MNILNIMFKEILENIRDKQNMAIMVAFPIILILILGSALSNQFKFTTQLDDLSIIYTDNGGNKTDAFDRFISKGKEMGIKFVKTDNFNEGIDAIKNTEHSCYLVVKDDEISFYKNERYSFRATLVYGILETFVGRYNIVSNIAAFNPSALSKINFDKKPDFVSIESFDGKKNPRAVDYYAVTMLTLIIMYAIHTGIWGIGGEKYGRTGNRILSTPTRKYEFLTGEVLGGIFTTMLQSLIVILVSKYLIKANWGNHMGVILLIVVSQIIMAVSLGTGVSFLVKDQRIASSIVNTAIPFMVFLGGGYVPAMNFKGSIIEKIANISPVTWVNNSIFKVIYAEDMSTVPIVIGLNLLVAMFFIITSSILYKKEEV